MTQKRLFHDEPIVDKDEVLVRGPAAHHLATVMRVKCGEQIEVRDGRGCAWLGEVVCIGNHEVAVRRLDRQGLLNESPLVLTVALGYARANRMDLVLRQATELGVHRVVSFRTARSQYGLSEQQLQGRTVRWRRIVSEALRQCGRTCLPDIQALPDIAAFLAKLPEWGLAGDDSLRLLAWEEERQRGLLSVWRDFPDHDKVLLVVGPEGGFTPEEVRQFGASGFRPVHLGPRTLRLETAATALIATAQLLWGDLAHSAGALRVKPQDE
jgi:16S rRNA (uracil1498-N3)-methyltransferase